MALTALKGKTSRRKKPVRRQKSVTGEVLWTEEELKDCTPENFGRKTNKALDYYRLECKGADFKRWTLEYMDKSDKWRQHVDSFKKVPENRFNSTLGAMCRMLQLGKPNINEEYNKYWESLPGTMGTPKPMNVSIDVWLGELQFKAQAFATEEAEAKAEIEKKKKAHQPTIQERIWAQMCIMDEKPQGWLDEWSDDPLKFNPKGFDFKKHFYEFKVTQAHARKLKECYLPEINELNEVLNPPKLSANATDQEKDWAAQLKEGYSIFSKTDIKKKLQALNAYMGALDVVIETAKATRKPRKKRSISKEKLIAKLKFALNDSKFALASINPIEIPGCNELWVFNTKTRKLGKYVAKTIDPLGQERDGTGLSIKGTTITQFNEETSIQKTLRKPEEKLKEFKDTGKRKLVDFLDTINAVDIKLNGRINPDTILLKAVR